MERLNLCKEVLENAIGVYKNSAKCFDEGLTPLEMVSVQAMEELLEHRQLEEKGLVLKLPCNIGDTVYVVEEWLDSGEMMVFEYTFDGIESGGYRLMYEGNKEDVDVFPVDDLGRVIFLSEAEAQETLVRMEGTK